MIRVVLKPEISMPREFPTADSWRLGLDSGILSVTSGNDAVAQFASGTWVYVEDCGADPAAGAA